MLHHVHIAIRRLLHERGMIDPAEVAVRFERPTRQWADSLMLPTLNMFLFDIAENTERRAGGAQMSRGTAQAQFRVPPRYFDLSFLVAAFATAPEDEHMLLWRALATLLRFSPLPAEVLPEPLAALDLSLTTHVGPAEDGTRALDLWGGLELPPRPALIYRVTMPLDLEIEFSAPLVLTRALRVQQQHAGSPDELPLQIGGMLRTSRGEPIPNAAISLDGSAAEAKTDAEGRYTLRVARPGTYTMSISRRGGPARTAALVIPSESYDLVVDEP